MFWLLLLFVASTINALDDYADSSYGLYQQGQAWLEEASSEHDVIKALEKIQFFARTADFKEQEILKKLHQTIEEQLLQSNNSFGSGKWALCCGMASLGFAYLAYYTSKAIAPQKTEWEAICADLLRLGVTIHKKSEGDRDDRRVYLDITLPKNLSSDQEMHVRHCYNRLIKIWPKLGTNTTVPAFAAVTACFCGVASIIQLYRFSNNSDAKNRAHLQLVKECIKKYLRY